MRHASNIALFFFLVEQQLFLLLSAVSFVAVVVAAAWYPATSTSHDTSQQHHQQNHALLGKLSSADSLESYLNGDDGEGTKLLVSSDDEETTIRHNNDLLLVKQEQQQEQQQQRQLRFAGVGRLYAQEEKEKDDDDESFSPEKQILDRLHRATVAVIGLGGVGSWAAEALCRSGIGHLVLVDLDDICLSNTNRQLHALASTVGNFKIDAMKQRLLDINPHVNVTLLHDFVTVDNVDSILNHQLLLNNNDNVTMLLDAIDGSMEKSALLAACTDFKIPVVTCGGAAGRIDPTRIVCNDLTVVSGDKLLSTCRKNLRKYHGFQRGIPFRQRQKTKQKVKKWNIDCVYSLEEPKKLPSSGDVDSSSLRRCDGALGTACFVTGAFGFAAAARVVDRIATNTLVAPSR